jgi:hypothetical protein
MDQPFLAKPFLQRATELFTQAEQLAESDAIRQRVAAARLPLMYVKLCRGPELVGPDFAALVTRFETVARRVGLTHIREGPPDLEKKLAGWRAAAPAAE